MASRAEARKKRQSPSPQATGSETESEASREPGGSGLQGGEPRAPRVVGGPWGLPGFMWLRAQRLHASASINCGILLVGVLKIRALLFGVYTMAPDF